MYEKQAHEMKIARSKSGLLAKKKIISAFHNGFCKFSKNFFPSGNPIVALGLQD